MSTKDKSGRYVVHIPPQAEGPTQEPERSVTYALVLLVAAREDIERLRTAQLPCVGICSGKLSRCLREAAACMRKAERVAVTLALKRYPSMKVPEIMRLKK